MTCYEAVRWGFGGNVGVAPICLGLLQILCLFGLAIWQRRLVRNAQLVTEEYGFQRKHYLSPSYNVILWGFGISMLFLGVVHSVVQLPPVPLVHVAVWKPILYGLAMGIYHFVADGTALFLSRPGIGYQTFHEAARIAVLWAVFAFGAESTAYFSPALDLLSSEDLSSGFSILIGFHMITFAAYAWLAFCPQSCFPRRAAAVWYGRFWVCAWACDVVGESLIFFHYDSGYCVYLISNWGIFGLLKPVVLYLTLRTDTAHWQGMGPAADDESRPLLAADIDISVRTATHLGNSMGALAKRCTFINFTCLQINEQSLKDLLGGGGAAKVYRGLYLGNPVAVKVYHPAMLDENKIDDFCKETALLSALRHPNIVHIEGVCVSPPCLSMVMELCKGSLFEMLRIPEMVWTWDLILTLCIDCASAVNCLHTLGVIHKDIKSHNFLIGDFRVLLWTPADVQLWLSTEHLDEFKPAFAARRVRGITHNSLTPGLLDLHIVSSPGDHRTLQCENIRSILGQQVHSPNFQTLLSKIRRLQSMRSRSWVVKLSDLETSKSENQDLLELFHREKWQYQCQPQEVALTPRWSAPEILRDTRRAVPTQKADVYSLGITLWEILTSQVPFSNEPELRPGQPEPSVEDRIIAGERPPVAPNCQVDFEQLLRDMWHQNPDMRPSMREVHMRLVQLHQRLSVNSTLEGMSFLHSTYRSGGSVTGISEQLFQRARTDNLSNPDKTVERSQPQPANMNPLSTPGTSSLPSPEAGRTRSDGRRDSLSSRRDSLSSRRASSERRPSLGGYAAGRASSQQLSPTIPAAGRIMRSPTMPARATTSPNAAEARLSFLRFSPSASTTSSPQRAAGRASSTPTPGAYASTSRPTSVFSPEPSTPASTPAVATPASASAALFVPRMSLPPIVGSPSRSLVELNSTPMLAQSLDGRGRQNPRGSWAHAALASAAGEALPPPSPLFPASASGNVFGSPSPNAAVAAAAAMGVRLANGYTHFDDLDADEQHQLDLSMVALASAAGPGPGAQASRRSSADSHSLSRSSRTLQPPPARPASDPQALRRPLMRSLEGLEGEDAV